MFQSISLLSLCLAEGSPVADAEAGPAAYASEYTHYYAAEDVEEQPQDSFYHIQPFRQFQKFLIFLAQIALQTIPVNNFLPPN